MRRILFYVLLAVFLVTGASAQVPHRLPEVAVIMDSLAVDNQDTTYSTPFRIGDYSEFGFQLYAIENTGSAHIKILWGISFERTETDPDSLDASLFSYQDAAGDDQEVTDCSDFTQTSRVNTYIAPVYGVWCRLMAVGLVTNGSDIDLYVQRCVRKGL